MRLTGNRFRDKVIMMIGCTALAKWTTGTMVDKYKRIGTDLG